MPFKRACRCGCGEPLYLPHAADVRDSEVLKVHIFMETFMHTEQQEALPAGCILTLRKPSAIQLRVLSGCVWLTESRDPTDHFLQVGDTFCLHSDRAVLEAQQDSLISLTPIANTPFARARRRDTPANVWAQMPDMTALW